MLTTDYTGLGLHNESPYVLPCLARFNDLNFAPWRTRLIEGRICIGVYNVVVH